MELPAGVLWHTADTPAVVVVVNLSKSTVMQAEAPCPSWADLAVFLLLFVPLEWQGKVMVRAKEDFGLLGAPYLPPRPVGL